MTPKAITIGDCFNPKTTRHQKYNSLSGIGPGGNPDLDLQVTVSHLYQHHHLFLDEQVLKLFLTSNYCSISFS